MDQLRQSNFEGDTIMDFWANFSMVEKIFIFIAVPATLMLLIQLVLMLIGFGGEHDAGQDISSDTGGSDAISSDSYVDAGDINSADSDVGDTDIEDIPDQNELFSGLRALQIFTLRGFIAFFSISGWTGLLFLRAGISEVLAVLLAIICGIVAMMGLAYLLKAFMKLQSDGTINLKNALGTQGEVYLRIPAANSGKGQVAILIQDRYREFDAITYGEEPIPTGSVVHVIDIVSNSILVVEMVK